MTHGSAPSRRGFVKVAGSAAEADKWPTSSRTLVRRENRQRDIKPKLSPQGDCGKREESGVTATFNGTRASAPVPVRGRLDR